MDDKLCTSIVATNNQHQWFLRNDYRENIKRCWRGSYMCGNSGCHAGFTGKTESELPDYGDCTYISNK